MTRASFLARRFAGTVLTVWTVFTLAFAYVAFTPAGGEDLGRGEAPGSPGDALFEQYLDWLGWFLTIWDAPVVDPILESLPYTLVYLVPALVFAIVTGIGIRIYTVAAEGSRLDRMTDEFTFLAVSIPSFLLAYLARWWLLPWYFGLTGQMSIYSDIHGPLSPRNLQATVWPVTVMGLYLFAIQLRYAGEELDEYVSATFVKTARAKGASVPRVGLHVFRNAAIPLLTLFFTDMLGMMTVALFVIEFVTHVPGLANQTIGALLGGDVALLLTISLFSVLAGVVTNFAQDVAYALFDPRVEFE